jgi:SAM-dependent methyltransferase
MISNLVRIHHAAYEDDIPFWISRTEGLDPVLEIGPGHGRVTLPLLEAGRFVVGVDRDSESLAYLTGVLDEFNDQTRQRISLIKSDIFDFQPEVPFGVVIIPCNTYSTFNSEDRSRLLKIVFSSLKEGGQLIASLPNPERMEEIFAELHGTGQVENPDLETVITHPGTGFPVQVSSRVRASSSSLLWDWIYDHLHPNGQVERDVVTVEHFPASRQVILTELREGGFRDVLCLGDYSGELYSSSSPFLIFVCQK